MRLVSIFDSPAPYTTPVLNALAEHVDLHVVYLSPEDRVSRFVDSLGVAPAFEHSYYWAKRLDIPSIDLQLEVSFGVARIVRKLHPDALLLVSWKPSVLEPLLWTRWSGTAAVMWAESTKFSGLLRGAASNRLRRWMTHAVDGYVTNGSQATAYLSDLGIPHNRIVTSCLPAGREPATTDRASASDADAVRFLFVGRLVPRKRPLELIEAFGRVRGALPHATLTIVGAGEIESEVREAADRVPGVVYVGRREGDALARVYETSDVLVLPALREVWGVVVNEALSHGLFVVTTDEVGSAHDLLDEETGLMLPGADLDALAPSLIEIGRTLDVSDAARRRRARATARCTPRRFADDIASAVDIALDVRATRPRRPRSRTTPL